MCTFPVEIEMQLRHKRSRAFQSHTALMINQSNNANDKHCHQDKNAVAQDIGAISFKQNSGHGGEDHTATGISDLEPFQCRHKMLLIGKVAGED